MKHRSNIIYIISLTLCVELILLSAVHVATAEPISYTSDAEIPIQKIEKIDPPHEITFFKAEVSAYTSSIDETDDTPNINAMGTKPGPGSIACPGRYPFGTKVIIDEKTYTCDDRMNIRYRDGDYFDIWIETKEEAYRWGRREVPVLIHTD